MPSLRSRLEAILFVAEKPATLEELCAATAAAEVDVRAALYDLAESLRGRGIVLREIAGGYRLATDAECRADVERFLLPPKTSMTTASLETLAIVAYLQPVTRVEVESLRGVNVDYVMTSLEERRLIRELGRKDTVGRPILYGTTDLFLEAFGLRSLDDLPPLSEGAPQRVDGQIVLHTSPPAGRRAAIEQIHESIEGHEAELQPHAEARLTHNVAEELAQALKDLP